MKNELPGIIIHTTHPTLARIFEQAEKYWGFDENIPSQLRGLTFDAIGILLRGGMIRILLIENSDKFYTNEEDIKILKSYVEEEGLEFYEQINRFNAIVQCSTITNDSPDKEMKKTFWKDYITRNLK